jgi:LAO/AO transport system kinase
MTPKELAAGVERGERRSLAKSITLLESKAPNDRILGEELLSYLSNTKTSSIRIGITGVPGAGKSTFIETFGLYVISKGLKVAVLAVDPTSPITGGSILGDKTRMPNLATHPSAFIRPSPSGGNLGGVTLKTRESIQILESAGYNVILVETVGVGQSEISISEMTDFFLLILIAGAGDELQGIKKGIMEMADLILINKADNTNVIAAELARNEYKTALHFLRSRRDYWNTDVLTVSALQNKNIDKVWEIIETFRSQTTEHILKNRTLQRRKWLLDSTENSFREEIERITSTHPEILQIQEKVARDEISIREATRTILEAFKKS